MAGGGKKYSMTEQRKFMGYNRVYSALPTPFEADGYAVNEEALRGLLRFQMENELFEKYGGFIANPKTAKSTT